MENAASAIEKLDGSNERDSSFLKVSISCLKMSNEWTVSYRLKFQNSALPIFLKYKNNHLLIWKINKLMKFSDWKSSISYKTFTKILVVFYLQLSCLQSQIGTHARQKICHLKTTARKTKEKECKQNAKSASAYLRLMWNARNKSFLQYIFAFKFSSFCLLLSCTETSLRLSKCVLCTKSTRHRSCFIWT